MRIEKFYNLIENSEDILMEKILNFAIDLGYSKYTSTLKEAWRLSISGLSSTLLKALSAQSDIPTLGPDIIYSQEELAQFGIIEAQKHRSRGITLSMFLGFMKYYQQAYEDLISEADFSPKEKDYYKLYVKRYFDFVELGFTEEWIGLSNKKALEDIQEKSRLTQNEKNKYLTIFESINAPVILFNQNNDIENFNNQAAEVFLDIDTPGVEYYNKIDYGDKFDWIAEQVKSFSQTNKDETVNQKTTLTEKGEKTFTISLKKMQDVSKKYSGTVAILYDITELLKLKQEKIEIEENLRQHQRLQSVGTLASGVAHEINNPINGIINYSQIILDGECNNKEESKGFLQEILNESNRISVIVNDLLSFSRSNKQLYEYTEVNEIIRHTVSLIKTLIKHDQIELIQDVPDNLPLIKCRGQQIQQVLMNMLTNARDSLNQKYEGYDKNKKINLKCRQIIQDGEDWLEISVEDFGLGITKENKNRMFDPFFTTKSRSEGTGLGLSISYKIIQEHQGELKVISKEGEFAKFIILLPCNRQN